MADVFSSAQRSQIMRAVGSRNTSPEMRVRRLLHSLGYRYRLHDPRLPGKPDIVLPRRRKLIFVHGCFWHRHHCPRGARTPLQQREYWIKKLDGNRRRDRRHRDALRRSGWSVLVVWECQTKNLDTLQRRLVRFLQ